MLSRFYVRHGTSTRMPITMCLQSHAMINYVRLRKTLRQMREARDLTLDQLAERTGLNRATIHSLENFEHEPELKFRFETVDRIAHALGLTLSAVIAQLEHPGKMPIKKSTEVSVSSGTAESVAVHGPGDPLPSVQEPLLIAVAQSLAVAFERAIDRLIAARAREREPRQQAPATRAHTAVRHGRHRKVG